MFWEVSLILIGKMKINIAGGTGVMGKVHRDLFEKAGHEVILSGRSTSPGLEEAAQDSDLTIVSVPIHATKQLIKTIAPYSSALMDLTGLKVFPIKAMLKYSRESCEVGGLHPLYGDVASLEGQTIVYCPTERSGEKCRTVLDAFQKSGLKIKTMNPKAHDLYVGGIAQNARVIALQAFALLMEGNGLSAKELYEISPPPTKILLDLIARQADEKNDELYQDMRDYNHSTPKVIQYLGETLGSSEGADIPQRIRNLFGDSLLREAQARAKTLVDIVRN